MWKWTNGMNRKELTWRGLFLLSCLLGEKARVHVLLGMGYLRGSLDIEVRRVGREHIYIMV